MKRFLAGFLVVLGLTMFPSNALAMDPAVEKTWSLPTIMLTVIGGVWGSLGGLVGTIVGAVAGYKLGVADVTMVCEDKPELKGYPCTSENGAK